jgi:hypothetical protein
MRLGSFSVAGMNTFSDLLRFCRCCLFEFPEILGCCLFKFTDGAPRRLLFFNLLLILYYTNI